MIRRALAATLRHHLGRGKSVLLLGPRQTGKTTLLGDVPADLRVELTEPRERQRYEKDPSTLRDEVAALRARRPVIVVDEVQRVPELLNVAQGLIDMRRAQFVLTGSSARKLRRGREVNLLPGRVVSLRLDPLTLEESMPRTLQEALTDGTLPGIRIEDSASDREDDLRSYVETYLEEEVRQEALVKRMAPFSRFLELAALESGHIVNFAAMASDVGASAPTVRGYYEILDDCLVAERVDPITRSVTRKKLTRSSRYLLFDLGVRRLAAGEGRRLGPERMGELFEQFVGLELIRACRLHFPSARVRFWRDPDGPEVDWVVEHHGGYVPVEVKWTDRPGSADARHLNVFLSEHRGAKQGFIVCRCPRALAVDNRVDAVPWQTLADPAKAVLAAVRSLDRP
ncbi:MAG: ATP-binding protein [Deltaproteobacteria bacterium]|nr:ATP-binding protein [Deltaproteobacteria bacterium]